MGLSVPLRLKPKNAAPRVLAHPVVVEPKSGERRDGRAGLDVLEVVLVEDQRLQRRKAGQIGERSAAADSPRATVA